MSGFEVFMLAFSVFATGIIGFDVWLVKNHRESISWGMYVASRKVPLIAFGFGMLVGVLAGHFWFQMCD